MNRKFVALIGLACLISACSHPLETRNSIVLPTAAEPQAGQWLDNVGRYHNALLYNLTAHLDSTWGDTTWSFLENVMENADADYWSDSIGLSGTELTDAEQAAHRYDSCLFHGPAYPSGLTGLDALVDTAASRVSISSVEADIMKRCFHAAYGANTLQQLLDSVNFLIGLRASSGYSDTNGYASATVLGIAKYSAMFWSGELRMKPKGSVPQHAAVAGGLIVVGDMVGGLVGFFDGLAGGDGVETNGSPSHATMRKTAAGAGEGSGGVAGGLLGTGIGGPVGGILGGIFGGKIGAKIGGGLYDLFTHRP